MAFSQSGGGAIAAKAQKMAAAPQASQRQTTAANGIDGGVGGNSIDLSHDLFDEEQTTENRGARRQPERVAYGPVLCRRRRFQAMM